MRRSGSPSFARSCCVSRGVMIAGHSAFATISPRCSRWPLIRADISIRRSVCDVHRFPLPEATPRSFRSTQIERKESPASARRAHSRITSASSGLTVRLSASYPYGRLPPPDTLPAVASSSCLRRIRRLLSSLSFRATAPWIRAIN